MLADVNIYLYASKLHSSGQNLYPFNCKDSSLVSDIITTKRNGTIHKAASIANNPFNKIFVG